MGGLVDAARDACPVQLIGLRWRLTPTYAVSGAMQGDTGMGSNGSTGLVTVLRQRFDFAASHRLHVEGMSDEENRAVFGKCNNAAGHGHNYVVEPAVAVDPEGGFGLAALERVVGEVVIDRFDHTNLNVDTAEFNPATGGVIPSVENIARVCFELLGPAVKDASGGSATVRGVTVWETDRTCCTYPDDPVVTGV